MDMIWCTVLETLLLHCFDSSQCCRKHLLVLMRKGVGILSTTKNAKFNEGIEAFFPKLDMEADCPASRISVLLWGWRYNCPEHEHLRLKKPGKNIARTQQWSTSNVFAMSSDQRGTTSHAMTCAQTTRVQVLHTVWNPRATTQSNCDVSVSFLLLSREFLDELSLPNLGMRPSGSEAQWSTLLLPDRWASMWRHYTNETHLLIWAFSSQQSSWDHGGFK